MPLTPVPRPLMSRPRRITTSAAAAFTITPLLPRVARTPANRPSLTMEIDLVIVTAPKAPGSRTLISPPLAVLLMAPAKVLHGAVREQGLTSSPTPDTHVREACASANEVAPSNVRTSAQLRHDSLAIEPPVEPSRGRVRDQ